VWPTGAAIRFAPGLFDKMTTDTGPETAIAHDDGASGTAM
jgi:hypothetical protein